MNTPPYPADVCVLGAGLVGPMIGIMLARQGLSVNLFERRADPREGSPAGNRSINLALSCRGWNALAAVGLDGTIRQAAIPMYGRAIHAAGGRRSFQPYGREGESIFSISRSLLNRLLLDQAEAEPNLRLYFDRQCTAVDLEALRLDFHNARTGLPEQAGSRLVIGADGIASALRHAFEQTCPAFTCRRSNLELAYKELTIPAAGGQWQLEPNALHIWPRGAFMMIALPNADGSFTCTLFMNREGENAFAGLRTDDRAEAFFDRHFPDALPLMPDLAGEFRSNPETSLTSVRCAPWTYGGKAVLLGDAAHAMVPFYGQGMNAGFEDCHLLGRLLAEDAADWGRALGRFEQIRRPDANAIAELSYRNFLEMSQKTADAAFLLRKQIEAHLCRQYPGWWTSAYSLVSFSNAPYAEALALSETNDKFLDQIAGLENIESRWPHLDYPSLLRKHRESLSAAAGPPAALAQ